MLARLLTTRLGVVVVLLTTVLLAGLVLALSPAQPARKPADGLPAGAQSTKVTELRDRFVSGRSDSTVLVKEGRDAGTVLAEAAETLKSDPGVDTVAKPVTSPDGQAAIVVVQLRPGLSDDAEHATVDRIRSAVPQAQATGGAAI